MPWRFIIKKNRKWYDYLNPIWTVYYENYIGDGALIYMFGIFPVLILPMENVIRKSGGKPNP